MSRVASWSVTLLLSAGLFCLLAGCGQQEPQGEGTGGGEPAVVEPAASQPADEPGQAKEAEEDKIAAALAKLSDADRAAAEKQKNCPVSGKPLGSMGTPVKVTVKGQDVFLCCAGCKAAIEKDPDKYLAKLGK
jgi:YHS domain-containing protein